MVSFMIVTTYMELTGTCWTQPKSKIARNQISYAKGFLSFSLLNSQPPGGAVNFREREEKG